MEDDLLQFVKNQEQQWLDKEKTLLANLSGFDCVLKDAYETRRPTSEDYEKRRNLILVFNEIALQLYGNKGMSPIVKEFGSFLMDMFDASSDLDLSINLIDSAVASRRMKLETLRKLVKELNKLCARGHVTDLKPILGARIPVVKVTDCGSGVECDFSVGNLDGIAKSQIVLLVSSIDERFQKLCFLMKAWAKAQGINSAADGSLNSLSLILLAAFHLQTRERPILPPFSAVLRDGTDLDTVKKSITSYMNYGKNNTESLADLFVSLLVKLKSADKLWSEGLCASAFEGSWICKKWARKQGPRLGCISVEDFTDRSQNASRAVKKFKTQEKIYTCIHFSLNQIRLFTEGKVDAVELRRLLFGEDPSATNNVTSLVNHASVHTQTVQGSPSEHMSQAAPALLAGQLVPVSSSSVGGYRGIRPGTHQPVSVRNEKKRKQPLPGVLRNDSSVISTTQRVVKSQKKESGSLPTQTVQGSQSENLNLATHSALLVGEIVPVASSSPGVMPHQPHSTLKKKKKKKKNKKKKNKQPPPGDLGKGGNVITTTQKKVKPQIKLCVSRPTPLVQGSQCEDLNPAPARSGQLVSVATSSIQGYGRRSETHYVPPALVSVRPLSVPNLPYQDSRSFGHARTLPENQSHVGLTIMGGRPAPYHSNQGAAAPAPYHPNQGAGRYGLERIPVQGSRSFGQEITHTENPGRIATTFMVGRPAPAPAPYLSDQGAGRYGLERMHVRDSRSFRQEQSRSGSLSHVTTTSMVGRPVAAPYLSSHDAGRYGLERINVQDSRSFGQERIHTDNFSDISTTFMAGRSAAAPYVPNQGPGRYELERNHAPGLSFQGHGSFEQQRIPSNHTSSFYRPEGTHYHRHPGSWGSRSHSTMPPNHDHTRSEMSYVPRPLFPLGPSHYPMDSREHENRLRRW